MLAPLLGSAQEGGFYDSLKSYFDAVCVMPVDSINARLDALIASATDDEVRAGIAGRAFDYFIQCPVMGAEGVSVYIADNYFLNKRLKWPSEETYPTLYAFAEFNRQSLLGMQAPELTLESLEGGMVNVRDYNGGYKVLYFYEDACSTCMKQTPLLVSLLKEYSDGAPLSFYAVYTQSDRSAWAKYAITNFGSINNPLVQVYNLWDPEGVSEFHKKYSVLSTPSLLLLDADNRIVGRKLDATALGQLLGQKESFTESLYGLLTDVGENLGLEPDAMSDICKAFSSRVGDDAAMYRDTYLGIFNFLRNQGSYDAMQSAAMVADTYILGKPEMWSPEMLAWAREAVSRLKMNAVGDTAPDVMLLNKGGRSRNMLSQGGRKYTVLFFNLVSCSDCAARKEELRAMKKTLRRHGTRVVSVYTGPDPEEWRASLKVCTCTWRDLRADWPTSDLYTKYDVSIVPRIYLLDQDYTILARDLTPSDLEEFLEE